MGLHPTTMAGRGRRLDSEYGCKIGIFREARKSDIGGYAAASEPVTLNPRWRSSPASDAMAVPQMPIRCTCCCSLIQIRLTDVRDGSNWGREFSLPLKSRSEARDPYHHMSLKTYVLLPRAYYIGPSP